MKYIKIWRSGLLALTLLVLLMLVSCQSQFLQTLFQEQEWSENYALEEGVKCTAMEMIDGDIDTVGMTVFPERVKGRTVYGAFPSAEAEVILPEKKSIHKIVIRSEDMDTFKVHASIGEKDEWKQIAEYTNNVEKEIVIKTSILTDKVKIRARGITSRGGDIKTDMTRNAVRTVRSRSIMEPGIQEIELYGYK